MLRHQQVFEHGHAGEQADVLEGAGHPRAAGDFEALHAFEQVERAAGRVRPLPAAAGEPRQRVEGGLGAMRQRDPALGGLIEAGDAVEDGGLAGAVRADDGGDFAPPGGKRELVDGGEAAEAHGEMLDAQDFVAAHQPCPSLTKLAEMERASPIDAEGVRPAMSPRGRHSITTTMDSPKISMR